MGKRILYIGNALDRKGSTPTTIDVLGSLLNTRHTVTIVSRKRNKFMRLADMCLTLFNARNRTDLVIIDVYSSTAFYFAVIAAWMCRKSGLPYVPVAHGGNLPERAARSPKRMNRLFTGAYSSVCPSAFLKDRLAESGIACRIIPNPIDISMYQYREADVTPTLLWVRSLHSVYNPEMALQVLAVLTESYPAARLTMVGPEKDVSVKALKTKARELGIEDKVAFTGLLVKQDWLNLGTEHSFFINTTNIDNAPVSVVEAMALGLVVVSTNAGGIPYLVSNNENGFLVETGNAGQMAAVIKDCLDGTRDLTAIRQNARQTAMKFDQQHVLNLWDELIGSVA